MDEFDFSDIKMIHINQIKLEITTALTFDILFRCVVWNINILENFSNYMEASIVWVARISATKLVFLFRFKKYIYVKVG